MEVLEVKKEFLKSGTLCNLGPFKHLQKVYSACPDPDFSASYKSHSVQVDGLVLVVVFCWSTIGSTGYKG